MSDSKTKKVLRVHFSSPPENSIVTDALDILRRVRNIEYEIVDANEVGNAPGTSLDPNASFVDILQSLQAVLTQKNLRREAEALSRAVEHCTERKHHGGLGFSRNDTPNGSKRDQVLFTIEAWLDSINSAERARKMPLALATKPPGRQPMTIAQKIFAHHAIGHKDPTGLKIGDVVRVFIDWVIASEISWVGMKKTLDQFGADYKIWRNDRFWLAGDHVVDPKNYDTELSQRLIKTAEAAAKDFKLTDYKGINYTIIHTEFVRSRGEPGMLAVGSDSHTCSSGAVGCLAIGLGAAEVAMALVTGETWFKVPESINVRFIGEPGPGIGGKDTILYILGILKRNTVAAERVVEFSGPGLKHLSVDARFAISNMCTEFGAITGVFLPDEVTAAYISTRKQKNRKSSSLYFAPDEDAPYADTFEIDLSKVQSFFAIYPNPDDVVPVSEKAGMKLDGCFIGACTTTLEDLTLAAMVLEAGLARGLTPSAPGKRHCTPGSLPVSKRLEELGLLDVYARAGFTIGAPGCSFCVGMGSDQAQEGEVWLSSQNRNFKNRMGKGSFGNLASAATVAASSFALEVTDPAELLRDVDMALFDEYRGFSAAPQQQQSLAAPHVHYVEPALKVAPQQEQHPGSKGRGADVPQLAQPVIKSKVNRLGAYIDTDALAPAQYLVSTEDFGAHCLEHTHPDFRRKVADGQRVVVAGRAFGVGSSREEAVRALQGAGVQAVVAPSFAFIYSRNQPNLGLLGIVLREDSGFYEAACDGADVEIDVPARVVRVRPAADGEWAEFGFPLTDMEVALLANRGISEAYRRFGDAVFGRLSGVVDDEVHVGLAQDGADAGVEDDFADLAW